MKENLGRLDRAVRAVLGVFILAAGFYSGRLWLEAAGFALILSASFAFCPLYLPFRFSTRRPTR